MLRDGTIETALGRLAPPLDSGVVPQELFVLIRPEDVSAGSDGAFCGQVKGTTCLGDRFETEIDGPGWRLWAMLPREAKAGSPFRFSLTRVTVVHRDEA